MKISIHNSKEDLGKAAAEKGAEQIRKAIQKKGYANIIVATGASQFEMLNELTRARIDWSKVTAFHLDEYIGIPLTHPASFRKYLKERFVDLISNAHLAFNDPPADLETEEPYLVVKLDLDCRKQQYGEGWFPSIEDVPETAISMSVQQMLKSGSIVCAGPDERKANAVKNALENGVSPQIPASILKTHKQAYLFLDMGSSSLLKRM
jgi:glucosamine-6-phosphate deaminase